MFTSLAIPALPGRALSCAPVVALLLCSGCSDEVVAAGGNDEVRSRTTELSLKPHGEAPPPRELVRRLEVPPELKPWAVIRGKKKLGPLTSAKIPGDPHGVLLSGRGRKTLAIPGSFPTHTFNRVVVELVTPFEVTGTLAFHFRGKWAGEQTATLEGGEAQIRELAFEPGRQQLTTMRCQGLRFELDSRGPCFVTAISFWKVPLTEYTPGSTEEVTRIEIGGDQRDAWVLSSTRHLRTTTDIPPGAMMRFGYGLLPGFIDRRDRPRIRVRIESGRGTRTFRDFDFGDPGSKVRWNSVQIPLDEHYGHGARVRIEIEPSARGEQVAAICEPRLIVPWRVPPTVLLVTSDSHRADHVGAYTGGRGVRTPSLDRLADRGLLFTDCYASTNETCPSYTALMTGTSPRELCAGTGAQTIPDDVTTLAEVFEERGWITVAAISSPELAPEESGLGRGFERLLLPGDQAAPARVATRWLRTQVSQLDGEALFAWLHLSDATLPYTPPPSTRRLFIGETFQRPGEELPMATYPITPLAADASGNRARWYLQGLYKAEVCYVDQELGPLLTNPRMYAGIVVFTSDHGESLGEHGVWFSPAGLYPQTLRVPLILAWSKLPPKLRVGRPTTPLDLGRTLLNCAGLRTAPFPGEDLLASELEEGERGEPRFSLGLDGGRASVTAEKWHLVLNIAPAERPECEERAEPHSLELYDLTKDGGCKTDLYAREFDRARSMRALLFEWLPEGWLDPECDCRWCAGERPEIPEEEVSEEETIDEEGSDEAGEEETQADTDAEEAEEDVSAEENGEGS